MLSAYFDQFNVIRLVSILPLYGDGLMGFTNSSMMVVLVVFVIRLLFKGGKLIPSR